MKSDATAAQRLLALGITASTMQLVRSLREGQGRHELSRLMTDRRRMLRELEHGLAGTAFHDRLAALGAAVAESDRTVEELTRSDPPV